MLLDINLPDMDGYGICALLKEDPALRDIPVIFVSALTEPLDKLKAFGAGGADYIAKPFDISEVDLDADDDEVTRLDFGALVATPFPGMQLQLQVNRETNTVQALMVGDGSSALEVAVFAAPAKSSMVAEIRADVIRQTQAQKGRIQLAQGPFGAELRRAVPVTDAEGKQGMHVSRTWLVSGPGWLLRGIVLGRAAFEVENKAAQVAIFEFFSNLVVRRGTAPAVPGSALPMRVPEAKA